MPRPSLGGGIKECSSIIIYMLGDKTSSLLRLCLFIHCFKSRSIYLDALYGFIPSCTCLLWHKLSPWYKLCLYLRHNLLPVTTYAANISIICRRRQFMPEILFVVDITGDNIHMYAARKKSPAYIVAVALYFYLYFLFIAFFIWLMVRREFCVIHTST